MILTQSRTAPVLALALAGLCLILGACPAGDTKTPAPTCGPAGEAFADLSWLPSDTQRLLVARLDDPTLDAAARELAAFARTRPAALTIVSSMELGQLDLELELVRQNLAKAGMQPSQLVMVAGPQNQRAFVWHSTCDLDEATRRMTRAWGIEFRTALEGRIGSSPGPNTGDSQGFPHDVLIMSGDRMALAPKGSASAVSLWLRKTGEGELADRMRMIAPAPLRGLLDNKGLVGTGASEPQQDAEAYAEIRITASEVMIGDSLPAAHGEPTADEADGTSGPGPH